MLMVRAALGPMLREYIISEAMYSLWIFQQQEVWLLLKLDETYNA